ncbi:hypothetical protein [Vannielia litorea]|uniref:DUF6630 family protein n=1 Tax=Vannielia litorea TaxID=1217970 RepID=UPI001C95CF3B|nr:hypothetical protein [Vannielia litorea]MBY6046996.1 hypothetical protein [Vannielia litorea]MBY6074410.1 hypothetical protein [Vannielia litorea]
MSDIPDRAAASGALSLIALVASLPLLAPPPLYLWRQGAFDAPRVKITRLITGNDSEALTVARAIESGDTPGVIEAETGVALDDGGSRSITLAWYLSATFSWDSPRAAYFDWKDGCEQACPQLDAMLEAHGVTDRPDPEQIIADEALHWDEWGAMPVVWAHYAPVFEAHGLQLVTLDPIGGWDAYYLFVTSKRTAARWDGVVIEEPEGAGLELHAIPAPSADVSSAEGLAAALPQVTGTTSGPRKAPLLAGLPLLDLF